MSQKKIKLSTIFFIIALILISAVLLFVSVKNRKKSAYKIAFYGLSENLENQVIKLIKGKYVGGVSYVRIDYSDLAKKSQLKDVDFIFTWQGAKAEDLYKYAQPVEENLLDPLLPQIKNSIQDQDAFFAIPLLLDSYNLQTLKSNGQIFNMPIPNTYEEFTKYIKQMRPYVSKTFYLDTSDEKNTIDFFGALAESICGSHAYQNLIEEIKTSGNLESISSKIIGQNSAGQDISVQALKEIAQNFIKCGGPVEVNSASTNSSSSYEETSPSTADTVEVKDISTNTSSSYEETTTSTETATTAPVEVNSSSTNTSTSYEETPQATTIYSLPSLYSACTTLPASDQAKYNTTTFPQSEGIFDHAAITPILIMVPLSRKKINSSIITYFLSDAVQNYLSSETSLAPVTQNASPQTSTANHIRYCVQSLGPQNTLSNAAFTSDQALKNFASQILN